MTAPLLALLCCRTHTAGGKLQSIEKEAMNDDVQARIANINDRLTSVRSYL